jgi:hypothetical protein
MGGDVPIDNEAPMVISSISRPAGSVSWAQSEVPIGVGCTCVYS